jgi:hypothetical protein
LRPAAEQTISPQDLLRASASWVAAAVAGELRGRALGLRAGIQAAQRSLGGDERNGPRALADLDAELDRLDDRLASLLRPKQAPGPRIRLLPEREVAAAVSLLAEAGTRLQSEIDPRAPRVTGRPGMIGVATLHLLLGSGGVPPRGLRAFRDRPDRLRVELVAKEATVAAEPLHVAVVAAIVEALGGRLDLRADTGPGFEVPLEL